MEVSAEAKRIMAVALGKLYSSRAQRGGLRLHRSLLLTLVMKSARDIYHAAQPAAESVAPVCEQERSMVHPELQTPSEQPRTLLSEEVVGTPTELPRDTHTRTGTENKENQDRTGPAQHSRKRQGKTATEPDFLPCKKAKLEKGNNPQQLLENSVLIDCVNCSSDLGAPPTPMPIQRVIAAC
nr:immediate early response gene 2 protein-like [Monopterus albus]